MGSLDADLRIRLTAEDLVRLRRIADAQHLKVSVLARQLLLFALDQKTAEGSEPCGSKVP